jgi:hypothetical protein
MNYFFIYKEYKECPNYPDIREEHVDVQALALIHVHVQLLDDTKEVSAQQDA